MLFKSPSLEPYTIYNSPDNNYQKFVNRATHSKSKLIGVSTKKEMETKYN